MAEKELKEAPRTWDGMDRRTGEERRSGLDRRAGAVEQFQILRHWDFLSERAREEIARVLTSFISRPLPRDLLWAMLSQETKNEIEEITPAGGRTGD
ncbi:hypothetical protein AMJ82_08720 [candidate division TA06 bacterium SM23_40]|jgi:hypothetical protein|uniref:Uncharacterized protein n=1 Tax=candidate division TA06 bacterium SM23_40 TaxID=1703774 RepID=A0A0S8G8Q2_UNCT6|nr:MAG: hypothetical protein AMJ82_08720 [candidate division TA06 bacterium SM23_40]